MNGSPQERSPASRGDAKDRASRNCDGAIHTPQPSACEALQSTALCSAASLHQLDAAHYAALALLLLEGEARFIPAALRIASEGLQ